MNYKYNYHYLRKINLNSFNLNQNNNNKINMNITNNNILRETKLSISIPSEINMLKNEGNKYINIITYNINNLDKKLLEIKEDNDNNKCANDCLKNLNNNKNMNKINMFIKKNDDDKDLCSEYEENYKLSIKDLKNEYYPLNKLNVNRYNYYYDIHIYLLSIKENKKHPIYPSYVNEYEDNISNNKKKYFKNICMNYELNNYNELCFKKLKKKKYRKIQTRKIDINEKT